MPKRLQNKIAGSRLALPVAAFYAIWIWVLAGLIVNGWWLQLLCLGAATYLTVLLNNIHTLIRTYSRMVSCSFLVLSCCACFLFSSLGDILMQTCLVAFYLILFTTYQDTNSPGRIFYAFFSIGVASLVHVQVLYFLPLIWLLMTFTILSMSLRTCVASVLGLLTPYWLALCWYIYQGDPTAFTTHFLPLADFRNPADYSIWTSSQIITLAFIVVLALIGTIHFIRKSYLDKIRIRMFYSCFIWMNMMTLILLALQTHNYDMMIRLMIVNTAPLIGHFLALTTTKITNYASIAIIATALIITFYNLWSISSLF
jgi:hypothetical protein